MSDDTDIFSLSPEAAADEAARLAAASYGESSSPTTDDEDEDEDEDEDREGPAFGSPASMAGEVPSRLAAGMGSEHAAWAFADAGAAQEAASLAAAFCRDYCPIEHRCAGDDCRVHRYEAAAIAHRRYDAAQETELAGAPDVD